jgi:uncharacterized protein YwqG
MSPTTKFALVFAVVLAALIWSIGKTRDSGFPSGAPGRPANSYRTAADLTKHRAYLDSLRQPAVHLLPASTRGFSRIGGRPTVPTGFEWPLWKGKPLGFLCQIDLAEVPRGGDFGVLPPTGFLLVFYDAEQGTWGFDPKDRGSWRVYYFEALNGASDLAPPSGLAKAGVFPEVPVQFASILTYPSGLDGRVQALKLGGGEGEAYYELCATPFGGNPLHQLLGCSTPVQDNDMDLQCQLVSNGIYCGDPTGYHDPRRAELEKGRGDWILLLQIDSDDRAGMMWGDAGMLYFWIRREDLARRDFTKVWMVSQCS